MGGAEVQEKEKLPILMIDNDGALALFVSKVVRLLNSLIAEEALLLSRVAVGL